MDQRQKSLLSEYAWRLCQKIVGLLIARQGIRGYLCLALFIDIVCLPLFKFPIFVARNV